MGIVLLKVSPVRRLHRHYLRLLNLLHVGIPRDCPAGIGGQFYWTLLCVAVRLDIIILLLVLRLLHIARFARDSSIQTLRLLDLIVLTGIHPREYVCVFDCGTLIPAALDFFLVHLDHILIVHVFAFAGIRTSVAFTGRRCFPVGMCAIVAKV